MLVLKNRCIEKILTYSLSENVNKLFLFTSQSMNSLYFDSPGSFEKNPATKLKLNILNYSKYTQFLAFVAVCSTILTQQSKMKLNEIQIPIEIVGF